LLPARLLLPSLIRAWLLQAEPWRALVEVAFIACVLTLPLALVLRPALAMQAANATSLPLGPPAFGEGTWQAYGVDLIIIGLVHIGLLTGPAGAFRMRRFGLPCQPALRQELVGLGGIVGAVWIGSLVAHLIGAAWTASRGDLASASALSFALQAPAAAALSALAASLAYLVWRTLVLAWPVWNRLRRGRLLWALTHAQLVASLILACGVAAVLTTSDYLTGVRGPPFGPEALPPDAGNVAVLFVWMSTRLLPALSALLLFSVAAALIVLPPSALISFVVLRATTARLEQLASAAGALRSGDLAARVPVTGDDEVARLQTDFNAMASGLEQTLHALQAERDRVSGLLEARRQLVAGVSHELRTPVATVRGYLEATLRQEAALPGQVRADLATMDREILRLQQLIEDLFSLARAEVGRLELRPESIDAAAPVRRVVETMAPLAWRQRRVEILADVEPDLPLARGDAKRLEQIVSNLLVNAVRYTPPGGLVAAALVRESDAVRLDVRDTGEGIPPDELPHVFERFYHGRGGDGLGGAGLGLALARELVEAMGGSIDATSEPGEGSCFTVRLPRA
jgi:signal transduction histidine kinase